MDKIAHYVKILVKFDQERLSRKCMCKPVQMTQILKCASLALQPHRPQCWCTLQIKQHKQNMMANPSVSHYRLIVLAMAMSTTALFLLKLYTAISVSQKQQVVVAHTVLSNSWQHTPQQVTDINIAYILLHKQQLLRLQPKNRPVFTVHKKFSCSCTKCCRGDLR